MTQAQKPPGFGLPPQATVLGHGDFVRLSYRLGQSRSTGRLSVATPKKVELFIVRDGQIYVPKEDGNVRKLHQRLEAITSTEPRSVVLRAHFEPGLPAYPPAIGTPVSLAAWVRRHLEGQLNSHRAQELAAILAGSRLTLHEELAPNPEDLDPTERRILDALREPQRLDQLVQKARAPRFRVLLFLHVLRAVDAVQEQGIASKTRMHQRGRLSARGPMAQRLRDLNASIQAPPAG